MKRRTMAGLAAALGTVLLPLFVCGMGEREAGPAPVPLQVPVTPAPMEEGRAIREIVVHQSGGAGEPMEAEPAEQTDSDLLVTVLVENQPEEMTLDAYLTGVLMGEMPASFELEALKAQAVAARTYTLRRMESGGVLSDDPSVCQAYIPISKAQEKLGEDWEALLSKLQTAVRETDQQVLTYEGNLIAATYFSSSGGKTESAQAVWGSEIPYLVSVESPGEEESAESTETVPMEDFLSALEITSPSVSSVTYTQGGGVDAMVIDGKTFSGTELRRLLGLRSTCFSMAVTEDAVIFQVLGYGHRVGLSQYGAQAMAREGKDYEEILTWYYTGVTLTRYGEI